MDFDFAAIILAAGKSERFGRNKIVEKLDGSSFIEILMERISDFPLRRVVIYHYDEIPQYLDEETLKVFNPHPEKGQMESIRLGLKRVEDTDGFIMFLGDMPLISRKTIGDLLETARKNPGSICGPAYRGSLGHPTFFPSELYGEFFKEQEEGARSIVHSSDVVTFDCDDPFTKIGVNTEEEFRRYLNEYRRNTD